MRVSVVIPDWASPAALLSPTRSSGHINQIILTSVETAGTPPPSDGHNCLGNWLTILRRRCYLLAACPVMCANVWLRPLDRARRMSTANPTCIVLDTHWKNKQFDSTLTCGLVLLFNLKCPAKLREGSTSRTGRNGQGKRWRSTYFEIIAVKVKRCVKYGY